MPVLEDAKGRFKIIAAQVLSVESEEVIPEAGFINDLGADSLDLVELIMACEQYWDIDISDDEVENIITVKHVFDLIDKRFPIPKKIDTVRMSSQLDTTPEWGATMEFLTRLMERLKRIESEQLNINNFKLLGINVDIHWKE